jgi:hypothetical protein
MTPSLSRNSSPSDLNSTPKSIETRTSPKHQTEQVFDLGGSVSPLAKNLDGDEGDDDDDIVDLTMLNISSSDQQVVCVEDDGDCCGVEDSIWREIDAVDTL